MEDQLNLNPDEQLHPAIANSLGIVQQEDKRHDIHPSLQAELMPVETQMVVNQTQNTTEMVENPTEPVVDNTETTEEPTVDNSATVAPSPAKDRHWRALREEADRAKALERELEYYRNQQNKQAQPDEDLDDYATNKKFKELEQRQRELEERARKTEQANAVARAERQLLEDFPDIRQVVSDPNIEKLKKDYPYLYDSLISSSDVYTVGATAYDMITSKGIYKKKSDTLKQIAASNSSARNQAKPKSASLVSANSGTTPIARANSYMGTNISSEEERKQLWAEMNSVRSYKI